jgi:hypothetical protein
MRRKVAIVLGLAVIAGIAAAALWNRTPPAPPAPAGQQNGQAENAAIAASQGLVRRDGPALSLRLKTGEVLTLTDRLACGDLPCPPSLATRYQYGGWDAEVGGYKLEVSPSPSSEVILPFRDDDPVLLDARHADRPLEGPVNLPSVPPAAEPDDTLTEWLADIANGRTQSEAPLIADSEGRAGRSGSKLTIKLADGRSFTLTDDLACGQVACPSQVFRSFDYAGRSPDGHFHVVAERWDEASAAMLIDSRTGVITPLLGVPKFSPDGKRAVATVTDLEWSAPRRLEVWAMGDAAPSLEFSLKAEEEDDTVYDVVGWDDAEHVHLRRGAWTSERRSDATLAHDDTGWHIIGGD